MAVFNCNGTQKVWINPARGTPMMKVTFSQLICLYQLERVMAVSAIWTRLVSVVRGRPSAGLVVMMMGLTERCLTTPIVVKWRGGRRVKISR